jgi:NADH-quinone oxidoreductase subunit C
MLEELIDNPVLARVVEALEGRFREAISGKAYERRELSVTVSSAALLEVLAFLKNEQGFSTLNDVIALDHFPTPGDGRKRFSVLYQLYRFADHSRVRVVLDADEQEVIPSVTGLYKSADWAEREMFDMFGLHFSGHPDLRRIYMPDDFSGHPLRKDFPLEG